MYLPCGLNITLLGTNPKEMKTYVHKKICNWMFIAVLFKIAQKSRNQPNIHEQVNG